MTRKNEETKRYSAKEVNGEGYIFDSHFSKKVPIASEITYAEAVRLVEKYNEEEQNK